MSSPVISVLLPVYNAEDYVAEAIQSILDQTFTDFELLVLDDGSTDRSVDIVQSFTDPRIRLIRNERNLKLIQTLNKGLELARGTYIARMDADDLSRPQRFMKQVQLLEEQPETGICGSWVRYFNRKIAGINIRYTYRYVTQPLDIFYELCFRCALIHPAAMIRASFLREHQIRYDPGYQDAEDFELWQRCSRKTNIVNIPEVLLDVRFQYSSVTVRNRDTVMRTTDTLTRQGYSLLGAEYPVTKQMWKHKLILSELQNIEQTLVSICSRPLSPDHATALTKACTREFAMRAAETIGGFPVLKFILRSSLRPRISSYINTMDGLKNLARLLFYIIRHRKSPDTAP